jgi:hypothetical protein
MLGRTWNRSVRSHRGLTVIAASLVFWVVFGLSAADLTLVGGVLVLLATLSVALRLGGTIQH